MKLKKNLIFIALASLLMSAMLTGCGGGGGVVATSGIRGVAIVAPFGATSLSSMAPLPGLVVTFQPPGGGAEIARTTADANGGFKIDLPPGNYMLVPIVPSSVNVGVVAGTPVSVAVTVSAGAFSLEIAEITTTKFGG